MINVHCIFQLLKKPNGRYSHLYTIIYIGNSYSIAFLNFGLKFDYFLTYWRLMGHLSIILCIFSGRRNPECIIRDDDPEYQRIKEMLKTTQSRETHSGKFWNIFAASLNEVIRGQIKKKKRKNVNKEWVKLFDIKQLKNTVLSFCGAFYLCDYLILFKFCHMTLK